MCPFSEVDVAVDSKCIFLASAESVSVAAGRFLMRLDEMVETDLDVPGESNLDNVNFMKNETLLKTLNPYFKKILSYIPSPLEDPAPPNADAIPSSINRLSPNFLNVSVFISFVSAIFSLISGMRDSICFISFSRV